MQKLQNETRRKAGLKIKTIFLMLLAAVFSISGIIMSRTTVKAAMISDDGKYALILNVMEGDIDGEYGKVIKFDVADGETTVNLSELTDGMIPFNGRTEFLYWTKKESNSDVKADEVLNLADFKQNGSVWFGSGEEVSYTNGLSLWAKFSDKPLKGTGTFYVTMDPFAGTINGKSNLRLTTKSSEFQTMDLTNYVPVREGCTFRGWDLNGDFVTSIDAGVFAESDAVNVTATYTKDTFAGDDRVLILDANGGTIDGKASEKYDYLGGADSGTSMSLLPYTPMREGYTFTGWNTKTDGTGKHFKYLYWRLWTKENSEKAGINADTIVEVNGHKMYKNLTLYASWMKNADTPEESGKPAAPGESGKPAESDQPETSPQPAESDQPAPAEPDKSVASSQPVADMTDKIQSTGETNAIIEFANGIQKKFTLMIQKVDIKKELADKNVKFIADINVMDGNNVVKISDTKMKIRIALPEELKGYGKYEVVYILDDEIKETIPATVEDGYLVFETSHLSQYGIVASNITVSSPKTGDSSNLVLWLAILSISFAGAIGTAVYFKKSRS